MGDHTEALQVDFAPNEIDFEQLADRFWKSHNPCASPFSRQYMSAIWFHDEPQKLILEGNKETLLQSHGSISTVIEPAKTFYLAEDYHQKYYLQRYPELMQHLQTYYPQFSDFNNSTTAARLNGLVGSRSTPDSLREEFHLYGLPLELLNKTIRL